MTLRDEVAQLVFIPFYGQSPNSRSREYMKILRLIRTTKVGGLILINTFNGRLVAKAEPYALAAFLNRMQRLAGVPLLVGGDFERGASMRVEGTTVFPHAMAFGAAGDPELSRFEGEVTAREARALGVQWIYYPVADVNNNPDNPIINIRSYGENPKDVAAHVTAFVEGAHSDKRNPVLATAKHFPGHGDTATDSHLNMPTIAADRQRLDRLELVPFRAAIAAGVDAIMTAHVAVPALAPPTVPATLSPAILAGLLRQELGFNGLVVTDALDMGGVAKGFSTGDACVRALEAGADALLMPADPDEAIRAVVAAVSSGRLSRQRIQESVVRLLSAKERLGLDRKRFVDLEAIGDVVDSPESNERAHQIAERALTLVRNQDNLVPLAAPGRACYAVLSETRYSAEGLVFAQELRKRGQAGVAALDPSLSRQDMDDAIRRLPASCTVFVVAAFASVGANRGTAGLAGELPGAIETIISLGKPVVLVAFGNPYLLRDFPQVAAYLATFTTVPPAEVAAVKALWGEIGIHGHLPVSIPSLARLGEGIGAEAVHGGAPSVPAPQR
ncbi:MAG TPA: glycoside hydrolase family 3 N-terminal domain-containing protein [Bryobacteraceae bacterium]|nr:glycoside hydrolase family 3 N-terminal domain-containing protein [Bryobacteraceae bacterium]